MERGEKKQTNERVSIPLAAKPSCMHVHSPGLGFCHPVNILT